MTTLETASQHPRKRKRKRKKKKTKTKTKTKTQTQTETKTETETETETKLRLRLGLGLRLRLRVRLRLRLRIRISDGVSLRFCHFIPGSTSTPNEFIQICFTMESARQLAHRQSPTNKDSNICLVYSLKDMIY